MNRPPPSPRAPTTAKTAPRRRLGPWLIAVLVVVGAGAAWFGHEMVDRFREAAVVWTPSAFDVIGPGGERGAYSDAVTQRMVLEIAPGDAGRLRFTPPDHTPLFVYAIASPLDEEASGDAPTWVLGAQVSAEPAPMSATAGAPAGEWAAFARDEQAHVEIPAEAITAYPGGLRVVAAASAEAIDAEALVAWRRVLPRLDGRPKGAVRWTRVELRVSPRLLGARNAE